MKLQAIVVNVNKSRRDTACADDNKIRSSHLTRYIIRPLNMGWKATSTNKWR